MAKGQTANKTKLHIGKMTGNTVTYTEMTTARAITAPTLDTERVDVTHFGSDYIETIAGMASWSDLTFESIVVLDSAEDTLLAGIEASQEEVRIRIQIPKKGVTPMTYKTLEWVGYCTGYNYSLTSPKEVITAEVTFGINGKPPVA